MTLYIHVRDRYNCEYFISISSFSTVQQAAASASPAQCLGSGGGAGWDGAVAGAGDGDSSDDDGDIKPRRESIKRRRLRRSTPAENPPAVRRGGYIGDNLAKLL